MKCTFFILAVISIIVFIGTNIGFFFFNNFRDFIGFSAYAVVISTAFVGSGIFVYIAKQLDEVY
ncbi:hypothetical protein PAV_109p00830 (plasmid) [Paenibacillus alvei DSM 29]|nr:hypothetical protein PAV_109p00830 [Paenibacillus alvei DSM 29]